jgi:hypothetical protein
MARLDNTATDKQAGNGCESAGNEQLTARSSPTLRSFITAKNLFADARRSRQKLGAHSNREALRVCGQFSLSRQSAA